jgi:hypothetical protein
MKSVCNSLIILFLNNLIYSYFPALVFISLVMFVADYMFMCRQESNDVTKDLICSKTVSHWSANY